MELNPEESFILICICYAYLFGALNLHVKSIVRKFFFLAGLFQLISVIDYLLTSKTYLHELPNSNFLV